VIVVRVVIDVAVGDVGVAGAVSVVDAAVGADADIESEPEFEFDVGVMMYDIDELEVVKKEEVDEETVDIANDVVVIEHAGEVPDIVVVVVAAVAAGVEAVGIDAFARYIVDADIGEAAEDYVGVALEKQS
jgi:hypothetical protein